MKSCKLCKKKFLPDKYNKNQQIFCNKKCKWNYYNQNWFREYKELRKQVIKILGNKCVACNNEDYYVLQMDHINSDRAKDKYFKQKLYIYKKTINNPIWARKKYQVLCCNCNYLKQFHKDIFKKRYPKIK